MCRCRLVLIVVIWIWNICLNICAQSISKIDKGVDVSSRQSSDSIAFICLAKGEQLYSEGNYPAALGQYIKGLKISERISDHRLTAIFYKNMGNVYNMSGDGEKALLLYEKALNQNSVDTVTRHNVLMNLVRTAILFDDIEKN